MDPNLFHLDWDRTFEALVGIVVFSFIIERALSIIFESRWYIEKIKGVDLEKAAELKAAADKKNETIKIKSTKGKGLKELIALVVSVVACIYWQFDAVSIIFLRPENTYPGFIISGAIIAGGSKGSIKLFRGVMGFKSSAQDEYEKLKNGEKKS